MISHAKAQELHDLLGEFIEGGDDGYDLSGLFRAREIAAIIVADTEDCEFSKIDTHEHYCETHGVTMIGPEPVWCSVNRP